MTYKTIQNAFKKSRGQITFSDILNKRFFHSSKGYTDLKITDSIAIGSLISLIGGRGNDYKMLISDYISFSRHSYGIFDRLVFNGKKWSYIAGQDYAAELNTIRKILREGN